MFLVGGQSNITISNNELVGGTAERIVLANTSITAHFNCIDGNTVAASGSLPTRTVLGANK